VPQAFHLLNLNRSEYYNSRPVVFSLRRRFKKGPGSYSSCVNEQLIQETRPCTPC